MGTGQLNKVPRHSVMNAAPSWRRRTPDRGQLSVTQRRNLRVFLLPLAPISLSPIPNSLCPPHFFRARAAVRLFVRSTAKGRGQRALDPARGHPSLLQDSQRCCHGLRSSAYARHESTRTPFYSHEIPKPLPHHKRVFQCMITASATLYMVSANLCFLKVNLE